MKDNEKNLNNALSDGEMEAVAGGVDWPWDPKWTDERKKQFIEYMVNDAEKSCEYAMSIIKQYSPKEFLKYAKKCDGHVPPEFEKILK